MEEEHFTKGIEQMINIKKISATSAIALSSIALMGAGIPKNVPTIQPLQIKESLAPGQSIIVPITVAQWKTGDTLQMAIAGNALGGTLGYPTGTLNPQTDTTDATEFPLRTFLTPHGLNAQGQETASLTIHAPKTIHAGLYESGVALVLPAKPTKNGSMTSLVTGRVVAPIFVQVGSKQAASMIPAQPQLIPTSQGLGILPLATNQGYGISGQVNESVSIFQNSKLLYTSNTFFDQVQPRSTAQQKYVNWPLKPVPGNYEVVAKINGQTATTRYSISQTLAQKIKDHKVTAKVVAQPQSPFWPQISWSQVPLAVGIGALAAGAYILVYYKKIAKK